MFGSTNFSWVASTQIKTQNMTKNEGGISGAIWGDKGASLLETWRKRKPGTANSKTLEQESIWGRKNSVLGWNPPEANPRQEFECQGRYLVVDPRNNEKGVRKWDGEGQEAILGGFFHEQVTPGLSSTGDLLEMVQNPRGGYLSASAIGRGCSPNVSPQASQQVEP